MCSTVRGVGGLPPGLLLPVQHTVYPFPVVNAVPLYPLNVSPVGVRIRIRRLPSVSRIRRSGRLAISMIVIASALAHTTLPSPACWASPFPVVSCARIPCRTPPASCGNTTEFARDTSSAIGSAAASVMPDAFELLKNTPAAPVTVLNLCTPRFVALALFFQYPVGGDVVLSIATSAGTLLLVAPMYAAPTSVTISPAELNRPSGTASVSV